MALPHPGWLGCPNVALLQRNQQMSGRDPSQCVGPRKVWPIGEARLGCDGHTGRCGHWGCRGALGGAPNELWADPVFGSDVVGCRVWPLQAILAGNLHGRMARYWPGGRAGRPPRGWRYCEGGGRTHSCHRALLGLHGAAGGRDLDPSFLARAMGRWAMGHNPKTVGSTVIFTTNIFAPATPDNAFVSAITHNAFATTPLPTMPYTGVPGVEWLF